MNFVDREFIEETVELDGNSFRRCKFLRCTFVYRGGPTELLELTIDAANFVFKDAATNTVEFLRLMYHSGLAHVVEQAFRDIRTEAPSQDRPRGDMELFKYTKRKYADLLLQRGSIRIGTLYDYRKQEHGGQIGDPDEGAIKFGGSLQNVDQHSIPHNSWLRQKINIGPNTKIGMMSVPEVRIDSPDFWVFSASSQFDEQAFQRWSEDPQAQYDCCYRIRSDRLFFQAVSHAIGDRAEYLGCVPVHYYPGEDIVPLDSQHGTVNPAWFKAGNNYGPQSEVRAIWRPRNSGPIEPFTIEVADLWKYCELHKTL